ncbi:hypothetical protein GCM10009665_00310 [Kitasatospora nipponensis]|uniref:DUF4062 domain-containing protein n=1 Tax=Kitasatospora nipponensis TaxID=258049 RepID=A0ABP4G5C1_9ACTN
MTGRPPGVLLSFGPEGERAARRLDALLRGGGVRTALDGLGHLDAGLPPGPVLLDLGACDLLVVLWGRRSAADPAVGARLTVAESFGTPLLCYGLDDTPAPARAGTVIRAAHHDPAGDAEAAHRVLVAAHQGRPVPAPAPPPSGGAAVTPGHWTIEDDATHPSILSLELSAEGGVRGSLRHRQLLAQVTGRWRFEARDRRLELDLRHAFGLRPVRTRLELQLLDGDRQGLRAEDVHGLAHRRRYRLERTGEG